MINKKFMLVIGFEFAYEKLFRRIDRKIRRLFSDAYKLADDNKSDAALAAVLRRIRSQMKRLNSDEEPNDENDEEPG